MPSFERMLQERKKDGKLLSLSFDTRGLEDWDSGFLISVRAIVRYCKEHQIAVDRSGLPPGVLRLLDLSNVKSERGISKKEELRTPLLERIGAKVEADWVALTVTLGFLGELTLSIGRLIRGRARFRPTDLWVVLQDGGVNALPIVALISVLVGLILAFVGSIQLKMFGAQIYIADLVGIAMVRAMGAIMTGIIMAGRTGSSYAARIGTMQVNEEIDALRTAGISPVDFLVMPRVIGLTIMMPFLTLYADLAGIVGGFAVSVLGFGVGPREYYNETLHSMTFTNIGIGLFSSLVFGILIGITGCLRGIRCGRSASAVGDSTTSAVVSGIVGIIIATATITVICNMLGLDGHM
jgi:phospholipid/cholesterol/gamma-HCH transport system permease protein